MNSPLKAAAEIQNGRFAQSESDLPLQKTDLQQLVDKAPDNSVLEVPLGRYELSKPLALVRRNKLRIAFTPGTQIRVNNTDLAVIKIEECNSVRISGVRARHVKPLPTYECHGAVIDISSSIDVQIDNCELNGCGAMGIAAEKSSLLVSNCHIHHNTFNAIYLTHCNDVAFIANIIEKNANTLQVERHDGEIIWSDNLVQDNGGYWHAPQKPGLKKTPTPDLQPPQSASWKR